jgi:single-stranded DNA-binding protein
MAPVNVVILMGNVGHLQFFEGSDDTPERVQLSLYQNQTFAGGSKHRTDRFDLVAFGRLAEVFRKHVQKGQMIHVQGHLKSHEWLEDDLKRYRVEVAVDRLNLLPRRAPSGDTRLTDDAPGAAEAL